MKHEKKVNTTRPHFSALAVQAIHAHFIQAPPHYLITIKSWVSFFLDSETSVVHTVVVFDKVYMSHRET